MLAPPRSFSQLATSFIACLCQGIHTHALSSLTIKLTPNTEYVFVYRRPHNAFALCELVLLPVRYSVVKDRNCFADRLRSLLRVSLTRVKPAAGCLRATLPEQVLPCPGNHFKRPIGRRRSTRRAPEEETRFHNPSGEHRDVRPAGVAAIPSTYGDHYRSGVQRLPLTPPAFGRLQ